MTVDPKPKSLTPDHIKHADANRYRKVVEALRVWDPLGAAAASPDAYDAYAPQIIQMLDNGITADELETWMLRFAADTMGVRVEREATREQVTSLVEYWRTHPKPTKDQDAC